MEIPSHIFQLSRQDLERLFAAANAQPGTLIRIELLGNSVRIGVDEDQLKLAMWAFNRNGGFSKSTRADIVATSLVPPS